jgi:hypothetical protein
MEKEYLTRLVASLYKMQIRWDFLQCRAVVLTVRLALRGPARHAPEDIHALNQLMIDHGQHVAGNQRIS